MLVRLILAVLRWFALRRFPLGVPTESFVYFDYYVPMTGAHDRIMIQDIEDRTLLWHEVMEALSNTPTGKGMALEITAKGRANLFEWLSAQIPITKFLSIKLGKDPVKFRFFAFDTSNAWKCSVSVSDVKCVEELRSFRWKFIEEIKRCLSESN